MQRRIPLFVLGRPSGRLFSYPRDLVVPHRRRADRPLPEPGVVPIGEGVGPIPKTFVLSHQGADGPILLRDVQPVRLADNEAIGIRTSNRMAVSAGFALFPPASALSLQGFSELQALQKQYVHPKVYLKIYTRFHQD